MCAEINKLLVIGLDNISLLPSKEHEVLVRLHGFKTELSLVPGTGLMVRLTTAEARRLAKALHNTADKAEDGLPRA